MDLSVVKEEIREAVRVADWIGSNKRVDCPTPDCDGKGKKADCQPYDYGWYCFVCKQHGNIFDWVMLTQSCKFMTAFRMLADHAGIALEPNPERSALLERFLSECVRYFDTNISCRQYMIETRQIDLDTLRTHGVGYCDTEGIVLERCGLTDEQLIGLGLLYPKPEGYLNYMGGRYVFPIRDSLGRLISLKGRVNPQDSADTDPRRKSMPLKSEGPWGRHSHMDHLYLEELLPKYEGYTFLCEGEPDALTLRSWGINAVGVMTNTGLYKYARKLAHLDRIYVLLDNDKNTQRHIIPELYNLQVKLPKTVIFNVTLPNHEDGKKLDVNDYKVAGYSKADLHQLATGSPEASGLIIQEWKKHLGKDRAYSAKIYNLIRSLEDRRDYLLQMVSSLTGVPVDTLSFAVDTCN